MSDTNSITGLQSTLNTPTSTTTAAQSKKNGQIDQNQFLTLLVTQLKNQDPESPMDNQQFAVQLAQFTSLEQLTQINQKIGQNGTSDASLLTGYLGREVSLSGSDVSVSNYDGGFVEVNLPEESDVTVQLLGADGSVVEEIKAGTLDAGTRKIRLTDLVSEKGDFTAKVVAEGAVNGTYNPEVNVGGVVTGVIPGADPTLLLGSREVKAADITKVTLSDLY